MFYLYITWLSIVSPRLLNHLTPWGCDCHATPSSQRSLPPRSPKSPIAAHAELDRPLILANSRLQGARTVPSGFLPRSAVFLAPACFLSSVLPQAWAPGYERRLTEGEVWGIASPSRSTQYCPGWSRWGGGSAQAVLAVCSDHGSSCTHEGRWQQRTGDVGEARN